MNNPQQFNDGTVILEPTSESGPLRFSSWQNMALHAFKHVLMKRKEERWEETGLLDRNEMNRLLRIDSIENALAACDPIANACRKRHQDTEEKRKRRGHVHGREARNDKWEPKERNYARDLPLNETIPFNELAKTPEYQSFLHAYQQYLSERSIQGCRENAPHVHLLKTDRKTEDSACCQGIKILDAEHALVIILRQKSPGMKPDSFVLVSGYRTDAHRTVEERRSIFLDRCNQKKLRKEEENHFRDYPHHKDAVWHNWAESVTE